MTIRAAVAHLDQIGSVDPAWAPAWRSIRHHFGIESFGVNAAVAVATAPRTLVHALEGKVP